jgi:arylsulfatase A-like enzyme
MYLSVFSPHQPAEPATRHAELFPGLTAPRPPSFNEEDISDKTFGAQFNPPLTEDQTSDIDDLYRRRVQSIQAVDELLVQLLDVLEETGQLENTYIIFTSDNGFHLGQHRLRAGKGTFYEEDIHVPFVIRGPGIAAGTTLEGYLTGNVDIAPTIAELAGVIPPAYVDGRSLVALLDGKPPLLEEWRSAYLLELYGSDDDEEDANLPVRIVGRYGLRTRDYLYAEYPDGGTELYDMKVDPYQLENISSTADPSLMAGLSKWLHALLLCSGSQCLLLDEGDLQQ